MKRFLVSATLILFALSNFAQDVNIKRIEDENIVKFANSSVLVAESKEARDISVRIYFLENEPGSAGFPTGEVSTRIIIAVSEYDEYPIQKLYETDGLYSPSFLNWYNIEQSSICAIFNHGPNGSKESLKLRITISGVKTDK